MIIILIVLGLFSELTDVYDQSRKREQPVEDSTLQADHSEQAPRISRSVKYAPYLVSGEVSCLSLKFKH